MTVNNHKRWDSLHTAQLSDKDTQEMNQAIEEAQTTIKEAERIRMGR
jgi:hypothetical protein